MTQVAPGHPSPLLRAPFPSPHPVSASGSLRAKQTLAPNFYCSLMGNPWMPRAGCVCAYSLSRGCFGDFLPYSFKDVFCFEGNA